MKILINVITVSFWLLIGQNIYSQGISINADGSSADPSAMLDIQSNSKGILVPRLTTSQRTGIANPANGLLVFDNSTQSFWFYHSGSWKQMVDATGNMWESAGNNVYLTGGNVGIGDSSPSATLTVGNGDKFQVESIRGTMTFTDDSASIRFPPSAGLNTPMMYLFTSGSSNADRMVLGHSPSFPKWGLEYHDTSDVFYFRSATARKFAFELATGDLGIGTENPAFPFDMVGRMRLRSDLSTNLPGIWFAAQDNEFDRAFLGMSEPDSTLGIWSQHLSKWAIEFEVMREPRIGINIQDGSPPRAELHVIHTNFGGSNDGVRIQNEGSNGEYWNLYTSNSTGDLEFYNQGIKRATIDDVSGVYTAISDLRLKTNINNLDAVLPAVMKLQPRTYQFTNKPSNRYYTGFLAQELEQIFPQFVFYGGDDQITYSVDYAGMSVIALKAIQEQQAQIDELKREIEQLKSSLHPQN